MYQSTASILQDNGSFLAFSVSLSSCSFVTLAGCQFGEHIGFDKQQLFTRVINLAQRRCNFQSIVSMILALCQTISIFCNEVISVPIKYKAVAALMEMLEEMQMALGNYTELFHMTFSSNYETPDQTLDLMSSQIQLVFNIHCILFF